MDYYFYKFFFNHCGFYFLKNKNHSYIDTDNKYFSSLYICSYKKQQNQQQNSIEKITFIQS